MTIGVRMQCTKHTAEAMMPRRSARSESESRFLVMGMQGFYPNVIEIYLLFLHGDHDFVVAGWIGSPLGHDLRRLFETHGHADRVFDGKPLRFEHLDDCTEILRKRVARTKYIQLFLHEEPGFISDWLFCIADVDDAPGKGHFFNSQAKGLRQSDGFDEDIRP